MLFYSLNGLVALWGFYLISQQKRNGWITMLLSLVIGGVMGYKSWGFHMSWNDMYRIVGSLICGWALYQSQKPLEEESKVVSTWNENDLVLDAIEAEPIIVNRSVKKLTSKDSTFLFKSLLGVVFLLILWGVGHYYFMLVTPEDFDVFWGQKNFEKILYCALSLLGLWLLCYKYLEAWMIYILMYVYNLYFWIGLLAEGGGGVSYFVSTGVNFLFLIVFARAYITWRKMAKIAAT